MINLRISDHGFIALVRGRVEQVQYLHDVPTFSRIPLGWVLHVTAGNGDVFNMFNQNTPGSRKFSTLWVGKNGAIRMYGSLSRESWAQVDGNSQYWSVETEGFPNEPLTGHQINSLARIHAGLELAAGQDYSHIANAPGQRGIGIHSMGGAAWGGHACPGDIRAGQRSEILHRARRVQWRQR